MNIEWRRQHKMSHYWLAIYCMATISILMGPWQSPLQKNKIGTRNLDFLFKDLIFPVWRNWRGQKWKRKRSAISILLIQVLILSVRIDCHWHWHWHGQNKRRINPWSWIFFFKVLHYPSSGLVEPERGKTDKRSSAATLTPLPVGGFFLYWNWYTYVFLLLFINI